MKSIQQIYESFYLKRRWFFSIWDYNAFIPEEKEYAVGKMWIFFFLQCFLIRISLNATIHESPFIKLFIIAAKLTKTKRSWRYQSGNQKRKSMNDIQHNYNERKRTKEQTMIYTTLHRKQKIAWHEAKNKTKKHLGDLRCSIMVSNSCSTSGALPANNCKLRFIGFSQS